MAISEQIGLNFVTKSEKKHIFWEVLNENLILYQCLAGELALTLRCIISANLASWSSECMTQHVDVKTMWSNVFVKVLMFESFKKKCFMEVVHY